MGLQDGDGLFHLGLERLLVLEHVEQLGVVDLEQHAGDFSGQVGVGLLNEREETLSQHLLLLLRRSRGQHGGGERLLARDDHSLRNEYCQGFFIRYR